MTGPTMISDIEAYFTQGCGRCARFATPDCSVQAWRPGLLALRRICRDAGLDEVVKWGHPTYRSAGRNIAILGAFRGDFRITFFDAVLLADPDGLLQKQGPNARHADCLRFTDPAAPLALDSALRSFLAQAVANARAGRKPPPDLALLQFPVELVEALAADPELAEAFHHLTPGRQRSYLYHLADARTSPTRVARILRARPKILAGKGATER